jgi:transcriptional regulator with XRE-family HTH domain
MNSTHYDPGKLKTEREKKRMSQPEVAEALRVHPGTVYRAEAGQNVSYELLCTLTDFYGIDVKDLLYSRQIAVAA